MQTTWNEQVSNHFVNFNRPTPMVEIEQSTQPLVDASKRASEAIAGKLERLNHIQTQMEIMSREEEALKGDIKNYMGSCSILIDANGTPLVSYKSQTKTSLDQAKFKASYPELFAMYSRQTSVRPFRII
jgi:hypothetical protein